MQISNLGGSAPVWDPKAAVVYYVESDGVRRRLIAAALRTSPALAIAGRTVVFSDLRMEESDNHANYDIHPDGSRFVMPDVETRGSLIAIFDWANSFSTSRDR